MKNVMLWAGAGQIGMAIARRIGTGMKIVVGDKKIENAQAMAKAFVSRGYNIISGGTDNHLMLIDLRNKKLSGKKAQETLDKVHITLNKNSVPFDDKSPFVTSGIRVGVPAITTRGLNESHMDYIVDLIDKTLMNTEDNTLLDSVRKDVTEMMAGFPLYPNLKS